MTGWGRKAVVALIVLIPYGGMAILFGDRANEGHRTIKRVEKVIGGTCDFWSDVAVIYGPQRDGRVIAYPPTSGPTLFKLQADSRKAYITHGCEESTGRLPGVDKRVIQYLPKDLRPR